MEETMSYRHILEEEIRKLPQDMRGFERVVRSVYAQALEEAKRTGHSIESMTYEILEGVEAGCAKHPEETEKQLKYATEIMLDLLHHSAMVDIDKRHREARAAHAALKETIEKEALHMQQTLETLHHFSRDHRHEGLHTELPKISEMIHTYIENLAGKIEYNPLSGK